MVSAGLPEDGPHSPADRLARHLGIELTDWQGAAGAATCELVIRDEHTNALGITHGGIVFALADQAIARASNRPGEPAVVTASTIQILRASHPGDRLVAQATEVHRGGRIGAYKADVHCNGRLVATATAQSMRLEPRA